MKIRANLFPLLMGGALLLLLLSAILGLCLGAYPISLSELLQIPFGGGSDSARGVVLYARLPRTLGAILAGAALAVAGAALQTVLSNRLASPSIVGVNAGAGFGVTLCCSLGMLSGLAVSLAAFCGSLLAVLLLTLFSSRTGASRSTVILGGVALNAMMNAASESIAALKPDVASLSTEFRIGGFSSVSYGRLIPAAILILLALALLLLFSNELELLSLGDDTARSLGLSVGFFRILFLILSALLAGAAVSFAGLLGFVGLIVPHIARRLVGTRCRRLLPFCALFGGGFVALCDLAARLILAPYELPVGILMALVGAPLLLWILIKGKGGRANA